MLIARMPPSDRPTVDAKLLLHVPGDRIVFPTGAVTIRSVGASIAFDRNLEFILKFEP